jgi:hypothetical protein
MTNFLVRYKIPQGVDLMLAKDSNPRQVIVAAIFVFFLWSAFPVSAETITLKSGKVVSGEIIEKTSLGVKVQEGQRVLRIPFNLMEETSAGEFQALADKKISALPETEPVVSVAAPAPLSTPSQELSQEKDNLPAPQAVLPSNLPSGPCHAVTKPEGYDAQNQFVSFAFDDQCQEVQLTQDNSGIYYVNGNPAQGIYQKYYQNDEHREKIDFVYGQHEKITFKDGKQVSLYHGWERYDGKGNTFKNHEEFREYDLQITTTKDYYTNENIEREVKNNEKEQIVDTIYYDISGNITETKHCVADAYPCEVTRPDASGRLVPYKAKSPPFYLSFLLKFSFWVGIYWPFLLLLPWRLLDFIIIKFFITRNKLSKSLSWTGFIFLFPVVFVLLLLLLVKLGNAAGTLFYLFGAMWYWEFLLILFFSIPAFMNVIINDKRLFAKIIAGMALGITTLLFGGRFYIPVIFAAIVFFKKVFLSKAKKDLPGKTGEDLIGEEQLAGQDPSRQKRTTVALVAFGGIVVIAMLFYGVMFGLHVINSFSRGDKGQDEYFKERKIAEPKPKGQFFIRKDNKYYESDNSVIFGRPVTIYTDDKLILKRCAFLDHFCWTVQSQSIKGGK